MLVTSHVRSALCTLCQIKRVVIFWFNWRNNASKSLSFFKNFEVFSEYLNCNMFLFHNLFQIENSLVLAQAPNLNVLPAAASYLDSEALLPFAKLKQVRNLVYLIMVKNIGISVEGCMFLRKGFCFYKFFQNRSDDCSERPAPKAFGQSVWTRS